MAELIFTIVGYSTPSSARIFFCGDLKARVTGVAWLAARVGAGAPVRAMKIELGEQHRYSTGVFDFRLEGDETPGSDVEYAVVLTRDHDERPDPDSMLTEKHTRRFALPPADRPLRFAVASCNGLHTVPLARRFTMWKRLNAEIEARNVDFVVYAGDQIYADPIWMRRDTMAKETWPKDMRKRLRDEYRAWYVLNFRHPEIAKALASCPSVMMWDDHEIYDGYGSNDDDDSVEAQDYFFAAKQAFAEFQASHGPAPLDGEPRDSSSSFACGFATAELAFVALDGRSHRDFRSHRVLGEAQFDALRNWLARSVDDATRHLFVITGIPPVHATTAAIVALAEKSPFRFELIDDLRDQWTAPNNRGELGRLLMTLFDCASSHPALQVTILSGDVHVGSIGRIDSALPQHRRADGSRITIHQIVASGISHAPPEKLEGRIVELASSGTIDLLNREIEGRLLPLVGRSGVLLRERNFAIVDPTDSTKRVLDPNGNLWVKFFAEGEDAPLEQCLLGRVAAP
jgi:hypothetical protein